VGLQPACVKVHDVFMNNVPDSQVRFLRLRGVILSLHDGGITDPLTLKITRDPSTPVSGANLVVLHRDSFLPAAKALGIFCR